MSLEKTLEARLRVAVKRLGGLAIKFFCPSFTGLPDRIVLMPGGRIYFVELKSEYKTPNARQTLVHNQLRSLGFNVRYINTQEGLTDFLREVNNDQNKTT